MSVVRAGVAIYKYAADIAAIADCPPKAYAPVDRTAFRFVFEDDANKHKSYLPNKKVKPTRTFKDDVEHCTLWTISMFVTKEEAEKFYKDLIKKYPKIKAALGTHVAEVQITAAHGICSEVDADGHFEMHEFANVDLATVGKTIGPLPE
jgi:hypothetical protein